MKDLPPDEKPRERLEKLGAAILSTAELMAILIRTGTHKETALSVSNRLLSECGGDLRRLHQMSVKELTKVKGIGKVKAIELHAAMELGRRLYVSGAPSQPVIKTPSDCASLYMTELQFLKKEHFKGIYLNTKNKILREETLFIGTLTSTSVHPREVLRPALSEGAAGIIVMHNHPSGDPTPSHEDAALTRQLSEACDIMGIKLLDHIVIGDGTYISMKEKGYMNITGSRGQGTACSG